MATPKDSSKADEHATTSPVPIPKMTKNTADRRVWAPKEHDSFGWYGPPETVDQVSDGG
jgi:hypothetical protein